MLFLNNFNVSKSVTCDATCMENMLTLKPKSDHASHSDLVTRAAGTYDIEEIWSGGNKIGGPIVCKSTGCDPVTVSVAAHGATTYVRLVPRR